VEEQVRYLRQRLLQGIGEEGQALFFATEVLCGGQGPLLQTAAAYLEAGGMGLAWHRAPPAAGFRPMSWGRGEGEEGPPPGLGLEGGLPPLAVPSKQRGFLGCLPCACPEGMDFWVLLGCFRGKPGFVFARGRDKKPFLDKALERGAALEGEPLPAHWALAAWAALAFEKLALGLMPALGGGSLGPWGEVELWEGP